MGIVNSTDALEIVQHFAGLSELRLTNRETGAQVMIAKQLLSQYEKHEIISVITYLIKRKQKRIISLNYVSSAIENVLVILEAEQREDEMRAAVEQVAASQSKVREVMKQDESSERNKRKAKRISAQSRQREFDYQYLFEGSGEDS